MPLVTLEMASQSAFMITGRGNSLRLFRVMGADVYLHWAWLVVAIWRIGDRSHAYDSVSWSVAELVMLFLILLARAGGQVLAAQLTGGKTRSILLWPLGCTTFISPSPSRGAELWRIAAGPLVNVGLFFVLTGMVWLDGIPFVGTPHLLVDDLDKFLRNLWFINIVVLIFNLLPIYPLDGGQMLRTVLSLPLSRARSLYVVVLCGFLGVIALGLLAFSNESIWLGIVAFYLFLNCYRNWDRAKFLVVLESKPQRNDLLCPSCHAHPPLGAHWHCHKCRKLFDTLEPPAECPNCHTASPSTQCHYCLESHPIAAWTSTPRTAS